MHHDCTRPDVVKEHTARLGSPTTATSTASPNSSTLDSAAFACCARRNSTRSTALNSYFAWLDDATFARCARRNSTSADSSTLDGATFACCARRNSTRSTTLDKATFTCCARRAVSRQRTHATVGAGDGSHAGCGTRRLACCAQRFIS